MVKNFPAMQETQVQSLGWEEKGMAIHSSILVWRIPWTEKPGGGTVHGVMKSRTQLWLTCFSNWSSERDVTNPRHRASEWLNQILSLRFECWSWLFSQVCLRRSLWLCNIGVWINAASLSLLLPLFSCNSYKMILILAVNQNRIAVSFIERIQQVKE